MPNNPELYNQRDIKPLEERYQDVNKNEIKFLGKVWVDIEYNGKTTKLPILITKRNDITPLLGVNWLKQLPITINKIQLGDSTNQSETIYAKFNKLFETNHTIKNIEVETQIKPGCYPIQQKARPIPYHLRKDVKKRTGPTNKIRTSRTTRNNRRRLFPITRSNYGKERPGSKNRARRPKTQRQL